LGLLVTLSSIGQGDDENERTGDEIIGTFMKCKLMLFSKANRPNVTYRIVVYRCPKDETTTNHLNIYEGISANKLLDSVNTDKYSPVFQKFVKITNDSSQEPSAALKETSRYVSFTIPLRNRKIKYDASEPKLQRYCFRLSITCYDAFGTLATDNIASFAHNTRVYYKDP